MASSRRSPRKPKRVDTGARTYFRWYDEDDVALASWFTELANYREFTTSNRKAAAARALREIPGLSERPHVSAEKVRTKIDCMIKLYKKTRDWLNGTGQGTSEEGGDIEGIYPSLVANESPALITLQPKSRKGARGSTTSRRSWGRRQTSNHRAYGS